MVAAATAVLVANRSGSRTVPAPVAQTQPRPVQITGTGPDLVAVSSQGSVQYGPVTGTGPDLVALAESPVYASAPVTGTGPDLTVVGAWSASEALGFTSGGPSSRAAARDARRFANAPTPAEVYDHQIER
jgi:hypothetical protein